MSETNFEKYLNIEASPYIGIRSFLNAEKTDKIEGKDVAIVGVPFDTGVTNRPGTRFGPREVRKYPNFGASYNMNLDVSIEDLKIADIGDVDVVNGYTMRTYKKITEEISKILESNVIPIVVGGDHSISYPELLAYKEKYGKMAVIHFDSHTDTWESCIGDKGYDHGTPFKRAIEDGAVEPTKMIQIGMRGFGDKTTHDWALEQGITILTAAQVHLKGRDYVVEKIKEVVGDSPVFVTLDIDFLDPAFAPGTGTPETGGFSTWETSYILEKALVGLNIKGFDLVEVAPDYDPCELAAQAAGNILATYLGIMAKNREVK